MGEKFKMLIKTSEPNRNTRVSKRQKSNFYNSIDSLADPIFHLQRKIGNQAVLGLLNSGIIQSKLSIRNSDDIYGKEADKIAEHGMRIPDTAIQPKSVYESSFLSCSGKNLFHTKSIGIGILPLVQQHTKEEQEKPIKTRRVGGQTIRLSHTLYDRIHLMRGGGKSLSQNIRNFFEPRFGFDFSSVRIHTDTNAAEAARALNSQAFTFGRDIVFGQGQFEPKSISSRRLLAHELSHVVQQGAAKHTSPKPQDSIFREPYAADRLDEVPRISRMKISLVGHPFLGLKSKDLCKKSYDATEYVQANVQKGDGSMTGVVRRLISAKTIEIKGNPALYVKEMQKYNYSKNALMHVGDCLLMKKKWTDPNIGKLPSQTTISSPLMAKIIATIYAEQTEDFPEQHRYIWYSIRKNIESWEKPAKLVYPGATRGVLSYYNGFGNKQYSDAKNYLITGKTTLSPHQLNTGVVDNIKQMVAAEWNSKIPQDAGIFYFHWHKKVSRFLNRCWKKNPKMADKARESHCVEEFRKHLKWDATLIKSISPYKTTYLVIPLLIPPVGVFPGIIPFQKRVQKKGSPPYGTMYIFKSNKQP